MTSLANEKNLTMEYILLGLLALLWGASYPLIKIAVSTIPPLTVVSIRVTIASILLFIICLTKAEKLPNDLPTWKKLFIQSCLNCIFPWSLLAWGQQFVDSSVAAILNSTTPVFVFLMTYFWIKHEATSTKKGLGAAIGLSGVILIIGMESLQGLGQNISAQIAITLATVCYAGAAIYGKSFTKISALATAFGTLFIATIIMLPLALMIEQPWTLQSETASIIAAIVLGLFSTGLALIIYFRLLRTLGSAGTTSVSYLRSIVAVLIGTLILGETLSLTVFIGIGLVLIGVILLTTQSAKN